MQVVSFFICSKNLCTPNILSSLKFVSLYNLNCVTFAFNKIHPGCLPPWPTRSPTARGREVSVISSQNLKTLPHRGTISKGCTNVSILLCVKIVQHPSKICQFVCWALNICISWSILCDIIVKTCQIVMIFFQMRMNEIYDRVYIIWSFVCNCDVLTVQLILYIYGVPTCRFE